MYELEIVECHDPYEKWSNDFAALSETGLSLGRIVPVELRSLVETISAGSSA